MKMTPEWSSHFPVLVKLLSIADSDVLEMGMGLYSTPLMHWVCFDKGLKLVSYDNDKKYFDYNLRFQSPLHEIFCLEDWDKAEIDKHWSVALIDHAPCERRHIDAKRLANLADYIVLHDTQPKSDRHYLYSSIYPLFKYRFDYTRNSPNTSVLSNFKDLSFLNG